MFNLFDFIMLLCASCCSSDQNIKQEVLNQKIKSMQRLQYIYSTFSSHKWLYKYIYIYPKSLISHLWFFTTESWGAVQNIFFSLLLSIWHQTRFGWQLVLCVSAAEQAPCRAQRAQAWRNLSVRSLHTASTQDGWQGGKRRKKQQGRESPLLCRNISH